MFYLSKITIFRGDDTDRYARWVALGIGTIAVIQQSVFDAVLGFSTVFLILVFILAVVFMFIIFLNLNRKSHYSVAKEMNAERANFIQSKIDYKKEKKDYNRLLHEMRLDDKLYNKTETVLSKLEQNLNDMNKLYGDELQAVDHLADLLRKAAGAAERNEQNHVHGYVQALTRDLGGLITKLSHDRVDTKKARALIEDIRKNLAYAFKDEKAEMTEEQHLKKILERHMKHAHDFSEITGDHKIEELAQRVLKKGTDVHRHMVEVRSAAIALKNLEDQVEKHMEQLAQYGYDSKQAAASATRDAIMTQDFVEAHKQLDHLRSLIEHGRQQSGDVFHLEQQMQQHVSRIEEHETALKHLLNDMQKTLDQDIKYEQEELSKKKSKAARVQADEYLLKSGAHKVVTSSHELRAYLNNFLSWLGSKNAYSQGNFGHYDDFVKFKNAFIVPEMNYIASRESELQHAHNNLGNGSQLGVITSLKSTLEHMHAHLSQVTFSPVLNSTPVEISKEHAHNPNVLKTHFAELSKQVHDLIAVAKKEIEHIERKN
jgi:hypothetical protein